MTDEDFARIDCELFESMYGHLHYVQIAMAAGRVGTLRWQDINRVFAAALAKGLDAVR